MTQNILLQLVSSLTSVLLALQGMVIGLQNTAAVIHSQGEVLGATTPSISNVQVSNITTTSAEITWTTDVPATSQVIQMDVEYQPHRHFPEPKDSTLTASHSVTLIGLAPNTQYWYYVASEDGSGNLATNYNSNNRASFTTLAAQPADPFDYLIYTRGAKNVYAGSDLYAYLSAYALGGSLKHMILKSVQGLPAEITAHLQCNFTSDTDPLNDTNDYYVRPGTGEHYCWVNPEVTSSFFNVRFRVSSSLAPGPYSAILNFESAGLQKQVVYNFNVLPVPSAPAKQPITNIPPIPGLQKWEDTMLYLGDKWCDPTQVMAFGYEPQIWYYDGGRIYFQLADYTQNPSKWNPCALNILNQYRDYVISRNGSYEGWRVFPHGLAMNYWRNGDEASKQAVVFLSKNSAVAKSGGRVSKSWIRETAYIINAYVKAEQLGEPRSPYLSKAVDYALGQFDQLFVSDTKDFNQPFFDGLLAEALIQYYELTGDPRIPPTIKTMLDWLWNNAYDPTKHAFIYNPQLVPQNSTTVMTNLIAPAYAWYWQLTGDPVYQQRGDEIFSHSLDEDVSYSGKVFSQNYRWSFDYVRYRSGASMENSTTHPENNTPESVRHAQSRSPAVDAGGDQGVALPQNSLTLYGTATDQDGGALSYKWSKVSGAGTVTFSDPTSLVTQASFSGVGTYVLQLEASNGYVSGADTVTVTVSDNWYSDNWPYRKTLNINHTQVPANLSSFPVMISVTDPDLKSVSQGGKVAFASADDILFTNSGNLKLPFEIEKYDPNTGQLVAWVKTDVSAATDTLLFLYFGNSSVSSQQDKIFTWDDNFRGVWHMNDVAGTLLSDSTINGNHATAPTALAASAPAPGIVGEGQRFGSGKISNIDFSPSMQLGNNLTMEAWINIETFPPGCTSSCRRNIISQSYAPGSHPPSVVVKEDYALETYIENWGYAARTDSNVITPGTWHHIAYVRDGMGGTHGYYVDGNMVELALNAATVSLNFTNATGVTHIGGNSSGYNFRGILDEIRVSDIARSADWIKTEYNNQSSPLTFHTLGATEDLSSYSTQPSAESKPLTSVGSSAGSSGSRSYSSSGGSPGTPNTPATSYTPSVTVFLFRNISRGSEGDDVKFLQNFLISRGYLQAVTLGTTNATGYFGPLTEKAVQEFQKANGIVSSGTPISTGYGNVGAITREKINSLSSSGAFYQSLSIQQLQEQIRIIQAQVAALLLKIQQMQR